MTKKKEWKQFVLLLMLLLLWLLLILYLHSTETDRLTFLCDQWKVAVQSCFHEQLLLLSSTSCCDPCSLLLFSFFPELVENQDDASFFSKRHNKTPWENYQLLVSFLQMGLSKTQSFNNMILQCFFNLCFNYYHPHKFEIWNLHKRSSGWSRNHEIMIELIWSCMHATKLEIYHHMITFFLGSKILENGIKEHNRH